MDGWMDYRVKSKGSPYSYIVGSGAVAGLTQSACRWHGHIPASACHYILPGQRLHSQAESINILGRVSSLPNYTAWWQRHACELKNLPSIVTW